MDGDCGAVDGMKVGTGDELLGGKLPQRHFVHPKSLFTRPGFKIGPPQWEARD
jgi:hypothetical protein